MMSQASKNGIIALLKASFIHKKCLLNNLYLNGMESLYFLLSFSYVQKYVIT